MDDGNDQPEAGARPLPPADRPWQHPSEAGRALADDSDRRRGLRLSALLVVTAVGLLLVGVGIGRAGRNPDGTAVASDVIGPTVATIAFDDGAQTQMATGVAVDGKGHVLVRASLLAGADQLQAACAGDRPAPARVVAVDTVDDVALVRMSGPPCRTVPAAANPQVGSPVMAVRADDDGSRLMWRNGSVRARGQDLTRDDGEVVEVFKTDAAGIGRRGDGVVFTSDGQLVGIVAAAPDDGTVDVLTGRILLRTATNLARGRKVDHPWIGVTGHDLAAGESATGRESGAMVTSVAVQGPADTAGITPGDVVVAVDGDEITTMAQLARAVHDTPVGRRLELQVDRAGQELTVVLTVGSQPGG